MTRYAPHSRYRLSAALVLVVVLTSTVLPLAGCSPNWYIGKTPEPEANILPTDFKKEIIETITPLLVDPTNVRDAYVSDPALTTVGKEQRYTSCIRYNPRDTNKRYMGNTQRIAYFYAGHLNQLIEATPEQCDKAAYKPFPELEKLCLAKKCE